MQRADFLRSLIQTEGTGLEIGPSYNPLLPKRDGYSIRTLDYAGAEELRRKYEHDPHVDAGAIEEVDYVLKDGSIRATIPEKECFDYIVASHVVEHTPDMLSFLSDCEALLKPEGVLLLAVPDKRHCFDVFQPLTSTGDVIQANVEGRTRPSIGAIFDDRAYNAVRGGAIGWTAGCRKPLRFFLGVEDARRTFEADLSGHGYTDVHMWKFVPSSFRLIVADLHAFGRLELREKEFFDSVGNEFYVTLSRVGHGPNADRITLAKRALVEQASIAV
jgi:SAM-dependent methyltransferase